MAKSVYTDATTETAAQHSGSLNNVFDKDKVQQEIDLQVKVSQDFNRNGQSALAEINTKVKSHLDEAKALEKQAQEAEARGDTAEAEKLTAKAKDERQSADNWQHAGVGLNMLISGLSAPTESVAGIATATLAPAASYEIGQKFKGLAKENADGKLSEQQKAAHVLAHAVLGAAVAATGGNDAIAGALSAGGAEAIAPVVSQFMYGTDDPEKLTAEQKETIASISSLTGAGVGAAAGNSTINAVQSSLNAENAVENNYLTQSEVIAFNQELNQCNKGDVDCVEETFKKYRDISKQNSEQMRLACGRGNHEQSSDCHAIEQEIRLGLGSALNLEPITEPASSNAVSNEETSPIHINSNNNEKAETSHLEPVIVKAKRIWWNQHGYSTIDFTTYENLNDYQYLTANRDEAKQVKDYLQNNTFNNTNQPVSLLRGKDLWYAVKHKLPNIDHTLAESIAKNEPLPTQSTSLLDLNPLKQTIQIADKAIVDTGAGLINTGKTVYSAVENSDEIIEKAKQLYNDPNANEKIKDTISEVADEAIKQINRTVGNTKHAIKNGDAADIKDDVDTAASAILSTFTGGQAGKKTASTLNQVADKLGDKLENVGEAIKDLCHTGMACETPDGIRLPMPSESRQHGSNHGTNTGKKPTNPSKTSETVGATVGGGAVNNKGTTTPNTSTCIGNECSTGYKTPETIQAYDHKTETTREVKYPELKHPEKYRAQHVDSFKDIPDFDEKLNPDVIRQAFIEDRKKLKTSNVGENKQQVNDTWLKKGAKYDPNSLSIAVAKAEYGDGRPSEYLLALNGKAFNQNKVKDGDILNINGQDYKVILNDNNQIQHYMRTPKQSNQHHAEINLMGHFIEQEQKPTKITMSIQNTAKDPDKDKIPPSMTPGIEGMCSGCMPSSIDFHNKIGQDTNLLIYHGSSRTGATPKGIKND